MLSYSTRGSIGSLPILFLHGFLGQKEDWSRVFSYLDHSYYCISVDLPGHGSSQLVDFDNSVLQILDTLNISSCYLVGYSMGGRLALQLLKNPRFVKTAVLSAHPGLLNEKERNERFAKDLEWIELLKTCSMESFLKKWYEQPLFSSFTKNASLFEEILSKRSKQDPKILAKVMELYSLGKMEPVLNFSSTLFVCGEEDLKYLSLYRTLFPKLAYKTIPGCGHVLHLEDPKSTALAIDEFFKR